MFFTDNPDIAKAVFDCKGQPLKITSWPGETGNEIETIQIVKGK